MNSNVEIRNKGEIEDLIMHIIKEYANAGFPFCRISPEIIHADSTTEKIILKIDEGKRVIIADYLFDIEGKSEIGPVKKVANFKTGSYFSSKEIERSKRNLMKTEVFEDVYDNIIYRDGSYFVLFSLQEKKTDYLTAYGSLAEDNWNFSISFFSQNILGSLRKLEFRYEHPKLFSLQFTEPILIYPAALNGIFSLWTYDSVRLIQFNGKFIAPLGQHFEVSLMSGIEAVSYFGDDSLARGHTNNILGVGFGMDYEKSNWSCAQDINFDYLFRQNDRWRIQYDGEIDVMKFVIKPHYYLAKTDSFEFFDYYRMGGAKNIRGYLEEEFIVSEAMWLNIEYKKFFVFPLIDIGLLQDNLKLSYGIGMEAKSDFANASLVIAWPKQGTWRDGKIHLIFERGF